MLSNFIDAWSIDAAEGPSQRALMEHTQPQQLMNSLNSMVTLPTLMFQDILDTASIQSTLLREQRQCFQKSTWTFLLPIQMYATIVISFFHYFILQLENKQFLI